ncbi:MAG: hypothetical protein JNL01_06655 [Bdellovibrionales bacterium]|nr:hypothetical protein [Bdellovibrionales bacterium]
MKARFGLNTNSSNNNTPHTLGFVAVAIVGYGLPWMKILQVIASWLLVGFIALFAAAFLWLLISWGVEIYTELKENRAWIEEAKSKTIPDFEMEIRGLNSALSTRSREFEFLFDERKRLNEIIERIKVRYRISEKSFEEISEKVRKDNEPEELPPAESVYEDLDVFEEGELL